MGARRDPCGRCGHSSGGLCRAERPCPGTCRTHADRRPATPPALATAPRLSATAVRAVKDALTAEPVASDEAAKRYPEQAEAAALDPLAVAGRLLPAGPPLPLVVIDGWTPGQDGFAQAAALLVAGLTALRALRSGGPVLGGESWSPERLAALGISPPSSLRRRAAG